MTEFGKITFFIPVFYMFQVKRHIPTVECEECGGEFDNESDWMTHKCKGNLKLCTVSM